MMLLMLVLGLALVGAWATPRIPAAVPAMTPVTVCAAAGAMAVALGVALLVGAERLATHWEALGNNAWGGTTDPSLEGAYRLVGLVVLVFGLALEVVAAARWVGTPRTVRG
jgi:hypothetical protein